MPAKTLRHPATGDELIVLVGADDSGGELFRFEYVARVTTAPPENHVHRSQEERVEVLEGTLSCRIGDQVRVLKSGDSVTFSPGVDHAVWNSDPAGSRSIGEYRPALEMQTVFERQFSHA